MSLFFFFAHAAAFVFVRLFIFQREPIVSAASRMMMAVFNFSMSIQEAERMVSARVFFLLLLAREDGRQRLFMRL